MRAFTRVDLTCNEGSHELAFTTLRHDGWVELYAVPAFAIAVVILFWIQGSLFARAVAAVAVVVMALSTFALRLQGRVTTLRVTENEIVAQGNLGHWFRTAISIPVSSVRSLHFSSGKDGEHSGIYVRHGWRRSCILSRVDSDQAAVILSDIQSVFPAIPIGESDSSRSITSRVLALLHLLPRRNQHTSQPSAGD